MADAMVKVTLPDMGESVTEGSIVEWRKKPGDFVDEGDTLVDVTTDKVDVEVPATASGVLIKTFGGEGDAVAVGAVLAEIDTSAAKTKNNGASVAPISNGASGPASAPPQLIDVMLPEMGESVTEGSVVEFRVKPGDFINEGDTVVEVTTDKVDVEVPAPVSGVITQLRVKAGDTVAVGTKLAEIDAAGIAGVAVDVPRSARPKAGNGATTPVSALTSNRSEVVASPQAQRIARKLDLDLASIRGSGPQGMILRGDVNAQAASSARRPAATASSPFPNQPALPPLAAGTAVTPLKGPAAALTGYMEQSLSIPTATSFRTLAVDMLDARRKELNAAIKGAGRPEKVSFTHIIAYALVRAASEMPFITYSFRRDDKGAPVRIEPGIHLGLAVDSERKDGTRFLVVPVIKNAGDLDFGGFYTAYQA
ncbi:MAG: 2-oxo acid dehydrogenase subunit E2, partial [Candidatus Eremiobacteraeota bacterium]|nr:2-oxo acid dehydrogenase subunit E2 [Candidatus Eremiobacteraeota bacterium]